MIGICQHHENRENQIWFRVNLYVTYSIDYETTLPFTAMNDARLIKIFPLDNLSTPLITSEDEDKILTHEFPWLKLHLDLLALYVL